MLDITIVAPEDAGISAVTALKAELMAALEKASSGSSILLDISATKRADSSLAQLIVAFRVEATAKGCVVTIKGDDSNHALKSMLGCNTFDEPSGTRRIASKATEASRER